MPLVYDNNKKAFANGPAIANATVASADPVPKADYDALVAKFNSLLVAARDAGLIST